jgi:hypothetical protein
LCSRRHEDVPIRWVIRLGRVHLSVPNGPSEKFGKLPDGAHPYGGGGVQPEESCGHGFSVAFADQW